ncbi:hypothetical protein MJ904_18055 [Massilia sp. MB5]|uniref:hypothetical protein n=1 Tax=unclassified Massilia TaxID=2609279 RepID=UPI00067AB6C0|nr:MULTISPECIES: hypothetical protein [unclassified Massilia]AKU21435.1 hypothetical protein ACZ75_08045 [Massilia sp. NR 4-1]UMR28991.1 hypothetical protein MJ904_18055 [Massilia sp. MB5]
MYALKVRINDGAPIVAGADDLAVLNAIINCVGTLGAETKPDGAGQAVDLHLSIGGLTARKDDAADEHLRWLSMHPLQVGDTVKVQLIETSAADAPSSGEEAAQRQRDEKEYFEHCKRVYLELKDQYEA